MCGIAGIFNSDLDHSSQLQAQQRMINYMHHRGPDDKGHKDFDICMLGQTRLSIIDLSDKARQPFLDKKNKISVAVNGEIYNYRVLREKLLAKGYKFQSDSDSEVVLHGYKEWNESLFPMLQGMFAISIYDGNSESLYLCRDRLGIKPLYFARVDKSLIFASEIGAIIQSKLLRSSFNTDSLFPFLFLGYMPDSICPIEGVESLSPGSYLKVTKNDINYKNYWEMEFSEKKQYENDNELILETRKILEESIRVHTQSDVPLGVFLSGGIDSTIIAGLVSSQNSHVKTLSVGFEDGPTRLNELEIARKTAKYFGTNHTEFVLNGSDIRQRISRIIRHIDSPSFDGINSYIVSEMAKESGLTVALSGLGGDELFGGYEIFNFYPKYLSMVPYWRKIPNQLKSIFIGLSSNIIRGSDRRQKIRRLMDVDGASTLYALNRSNTWPSEILKLVSEDISHSSTSEDLFNLFKVNSKDPWKSLQEREIKNYVTSRLLRDTDAMSMAHSIEVRVPLLDDNLVEHVISLPSLSKSPLGYPKRLLIESTRDLLPDFVLNRRKQGFQLPMEVWMRNELEDVVKDVFSQDSIKQRGLFNEREMSKLLSMFKQNQVTYDVIWKFVTLELWLREHKVNV